MKISFRGFVSLASLFLLCCIHNYSHAQTQELIQLDNWRTYSSMLNSVAADADSKGRIWIGTNGGAYCFNPADKSIKEFRNIDAMLSMDISAVVANPAGKEVFIGTYDGILEIVSEDFEWTHITDIQKPGFPNPRINDIKFSNNLAYIAGGFGLTVLDVTNKVFLQTPARLGNFQPLTNVNKILIHNARLWLATDEGVASIEMNKSLINPDNWINYTADSGLTKGKVKGITSVNNQIYCYNDSNVFKKTDTGFIKVLRTEPWDNIRNVAQYDGKLIYASPFWIRDFDGNFLFSFVDTKDSAMLNGFVVTKDERYLLGLNNDAGIVIINKNNELIKPESPVSNLFNDLSIAPDGALWAATDYSSGKGFMKLSDDKWENFTTKNHPEIVTNSYHRVFCLPDGRVVLSSWGSGFLTLTGSKDNYEFKISNNINSCLTGINNAPNWVVTGQPAYDKRNGSLWVINYAQNFPGSMLYSNSKTGAEYCGPSNSQREYLILACDYSGTKWLGSNNGLGLYYFNEGQKTDDVSDDIQGSFTSSNSQLQSTNINCITVDKSGVIWIGTPDGLAYILSPSSVLRNANPILRPSPLKVLASLPVNDVMIDALNNKWIATNQGVYVLDPDGATEIQKFTVSNSNLISDEVLSLASDENTGKIYFGTRKGLSEAQSFAIKPLESFNIKCFPQPYRPGRDVNLTIEGLAANADIRIVSPDGTLIRALETGSQKLLWDGKDEKGELVPSGIYLIIGTSLSSDASAIGKIAVVAE